MFGHQISSYPGKSCNIRSTKFLQMVPQSSCLQLPPRSVAYSMSHRCGDVDLVCCCARNWCRQTSRTTSVRDLPCCSRPGGWRIVVLAPCDATPYNLPSSSPAVVPPMLRLALKAEQWRGGPLNNTYHFLFSSPTSGPLGLDVNATSLLSAATPLCHTTLVYSLARIQILVTYAPTP